MRGARGVGAGLTVAEVHGAQSPLHVVWTPSIALLARLLVMHSALSTRMARPVVARADIQQACVTFAMVPHVASMTLDYTVRQAACARGCGLEGGTVGALAWVALFRTEIVRYRNS